MNKAFELILDELGKQSFYLQTEGTKQEKFIYTEKAKQIVQKVAEEYSYLSKGFDNGFLKRISDYFSSVYEGDDRTAPKMEFSVEELRDIASLNVEKCRLQSEIRHIKSNVDNNDWIQCSKELPQQNELMKVWLSFTNNICSNNKTYSYVKKAIWCYDHFEYDNGKVVSDTPIAWKKYYAPEPYQPKGEL